MDLCVDFKCIVKINDVNRDELSLICVDVQNKIVELTQAVDNDDQLTDRQYNKLVGLIKYVKSRVSKYD